jgi:hypothetical protein
MVLVARSVLCHTAAGTHGGPQVVDFQAKASFYEWRKDLGAGRALRERSTSFLKTAAIVPD